MKALSSGAEVLSSDSDPWWLGGLGFGDDMLGLARLMGLSDDPGPPRGVLSVVIGCPEAVTTAVLLRLTGVNLGWTSSPYLAVVAGIMKVVGKVLVAVGNP